MDNLLTNEQHDILLDLRAWLDRWDSVTPFQYALEGLLIELTNLADNDRYVDFYSYIPEKVGAMRRAVEAERERANAKMPSTS